MISVTRRFQFCAGHRVYKHESKCAHPHGHNYVLLVHAHGELDSLGRVIDFSVLKQKIGDWLDKYWDHGFLIYELDLDLKEMLRKGSFKHWVLSQNPTAENMAKYLLEVVCPSVLVDTAVTVFKIELWETENCKATVEL